MADNAKKDVGLNRREFLTEAIRAASLLALGSTIGLLATSRASARASVWQIDPYKCTNCGKCATECVLHPSAVKCMRSYKICGYCDMCFGFFKANPDAKAESAENERCPVGAIQRRSVEYPYYEYMIDTEKCIGCGNCTGGCNDFGNGSMFLQISHDICMHCNQCSIARVCPPQAISRIPADVAYLKKPREKK